MKIGNWNLTRGKASLLILFLSAMAVSVVRMFTSLATVTNLNDSTPWGLWKAWDVIIIVLFFENLPRLMEQSGKAFLLKLERSLHVILPVFVLAGILLSTMHQSSLGTLYMIVGKRIDPLWYHPWLNYIFLLTAIAAGFSVTILIEAASNLLYKTEFETGLLARLAVAVDVVLVITLAWRLETLAAGGALKEIFVARYETFLWWLEILAGYVAPILILSNRKWRNNRRWLVWAAGMTVFGMVLLRLNVVFTGMNTDMNVHYFPSWTEWLFSIGFTAGTLLAWTWFAEALPGILRNCNYLRSTIAMSSGKRYYQE